ncbi:hypothetical protein [Dictyobacter kobayashii]|uniref:hypothetical protein n=1 Tax=Dictyobacter kobayashii TaxID=2014872 RepID=UPI000F8251B3|nr:hypothetical protein [Dictyobacter kobayashii]
MVVPSGRETHEEGGRRTEPAMEPSQVALGAVAGEDHPERDAPGGVRAQGEMSADPVSVWRAADSEVRLRRRRVIAYVDVRRGEGMMDVGTPFTFGRQAPLSEVLEAVPQLGEASQVRLWLCGELPCDSSGSYEGWVLAGNCASATRRAHAGITSRMSGQKRRWRATDGVGVSRRSRFGTSFRGLGPSVEPPRREQRWCC